MDKWYKLAKEKGYRARAAFKLVQLNRKYGFLEKSKVLLDLCAAPGSWCQVAAESMPTNSIIVGVDLAPIKPIPRAITFQGDITSDKCKASIRQHLKTWKADTVLHDGAPNVGIAWVQDAYSQAELVLQALKLATDFLIEGGTFVTKVFRSKDYNALLWVFNQLFRKVEATKPPSSRNVSAEIFVVCRGFKAPKRIDPKFLDPRAVFAELSSSSNNNEAKVFNPEKKKRKRDGYEEGDYTQFKEVLASEFIQTSDPIAVLGSYNQIKFEQEGNGDIALAALSRLPETTDEIRQCCSDLKVLGRRDFRMLLRWRLKAREVFGFASKDKRSKVEVGGEVAEIAPMDEELKIEEELEKLNEGEDARKKRQRRRENEKRQKEIVRMQMHMTTPTEIGLDQQGPAGENSMFGLSAIDKAGAVDKIARGPMGVVVQQQPSSKAEVESDLSSDEEADDLDDELDDLYAQYRERKSESDAKYKAKKAREEHGDGEWQGISDGNDSPDDGSLEEDDPSERSSSEPDAKLGHLIFPRRSIGSEGNGLTQRATQFFEQDIFKDVMGGSVQDESDDDSAVDLKADRLRANDDIQDSPESVGNGSKGIKGNPNLQERKYDSSDEDEESSSEQDQALEDADDDAEKSFEVVKSSISDWEAQGEPRKDGRLDIDIITAEAMTLAQQIALGQKSTQDLMDDGFNKYTFRDTDGLPEWFLDDENRYSKLQRPVSAAAAAAIKQKLRALNARPIKKVQEAKDRKKFKAARKLEKLRRKSALLADDDGVSEKDKAQSIAKLMSKAAKKKPKQRPKLVVATGTNRGISGRPRGVKGKYKIVDPRLKKDTRAEKRLAKKKR